MPWSTRSGGLAGFARPARAAAATLWLLFRRGKPRAAFGSGRVAYRRAPPPERRSEQQRLGVSLAEARLQDDACTCSAYAARGCRLLNRLLLFEAGSRGREQ